jgi:hypothetical protein
VPAALYVWDGLWLVLVPPSPNVHAHDVGVFPDVSTNDTASGAVPLEGSARNPAVGVITVGPGGLLVLAGRMTKFNPPM